MQRSKRHYKGGSSSQNKRIRQEKAAQWKSTRGDEQRPVAQEGQHVSSNGFVLENGRFEAFYSAQKITADEADWQQFLEALRRTLPACFRLNSDNAFLAPLRAQLLEYAGSSITVEDSSGSTVEIAPVEQLRWYPEGNGYKMGTDRRSIRKKEELSDLHKWLVQHTENGNITRQEAVSMVPPLALDVQPHHYCLDMCAAPGSKTSQLLEVANRSLRGSDLSSEQQARQGLVVANDVSTDRAYMLVHQCKRINSPLLVITTHKGQGFPSIRRQPPLPEATSAGATSSSELGTEFFDRVLCDVPCSGDGTMRKNPMIWGKWNTQQSLSLHSLQLQIARRGLNLLRTGGLLVYSTCSMSPYEDEAVVAELLRGANGELELVDAREFLPLFQSRPGMTHWHVLDDSPALRREQLRRKHAKMHADSEEKGHDKGEEEKEGVSGGVEEKRNEEDEKDDTEGKVNQKAKEALLGQAESEANEAEESDAQYTSNVTDPSSLEDPLLRACVNMGMNYFSSPESSGMRYRRSLFPPSEEELQWMNLERCLRCVPHDEDTGGFFVATLRKVFRPDSKGIQKNDSGSNMKGEQEGFEAEVLATAAAAEEEVGGKAEIPEKETQYRNSRGLVDFQQWDTQAYEKLRDFYGLDASAIPASAMFVREDFSTQDSRNKGKSKGQGHQGISKSVYYLPWAAQQVLAGDRGGRLKVVSAGIKIFERKSDRGGEIDYRLMQDALPYFVPFISKRKMKVTAQDFCNLVEGGLVSFSTLSPATTLGLCAMPLGVVICFYEFDPADVISSSVQSAVTAPVQMQAPGHAFHMICWKGGSAALNCLCGKSQLAAFKHELEALAVLRPKIQAAHRLLAELESKQKEEREQSKEIEMEETQTKRVTEEATETDK